MNYIQKKQNKNIFQKYLLISILAETVWNERKLNEKYKVHGQKFIFKCFKLQTPFSVSEAKVLPCPFMLSFR